MWESCILSLLERRAGRRGSHPMLSLHAPELLLDFGRRWHLRLGGRVCPRLLACGCSGESAQAGEPLFESESDRR